MGGFFVIGLGVWVLAQVLGGDALGRLGLLPHDDESAAYNDPSTRGGRGPGGFGGGGGGGAGGGGSW